MASSTHRCSSYWKGNLRVRPRLRSPTLFTYRWKCFQKGQQTSKLDFESIEEVAWFGKSHHGPISWGCRIHWLHLCREVRLHQRVSIGFSNAKALGNAEYPFTAIGPWSILVRSGSTWKDHICGSNRTRLYNYAKLNCLMRTVFTFNGVSTKNVYLC